jgi:hypothetical protein
MVSHLVTIFVLIFTEVVFGSLGGPCLSCLEAERDFTSLVDNPGISSLRRRAEPSSVVTSNAYDEFVKFYKVPSGE